MMQAKSAPTSVVRVGVGLAIVAALAGQLQYLADADLLRTVNFFSFFTVDSNIGACLVLVGLECGAATPFGRFARWARGGVTLYMTMTGVIYAVLLAPIAADVSTQLAWVNLTLHIVAPAVMVLDWFTNPPRPVPTPRDLVGWLVFPIAWIGYTIVRGLAVDWYPYPFIDPRSGVEHAAGSWAAVAISIAVLTVAVVVLAFGLRAAAASSPFGSEPATVDR